MAKPIEKRRHDEAERAFRKAWKLLDRIERRLERARAEERKRIVQLGDGTGPHSPRRAAQLAAARAEVAQIEGLLTELTELITHNARGSSGQTVKDISHSVAAEIKDEAAEPPQLPTRSRNRHHRPRRKPALTDDAATESGANDAATTESTPADGSTPIALPPPVEVGSGKPTASEAAEPGRTETAPSRPASVAYRSMVSQPPDRRPLRRTTAAAGEHDEPGVADGPDGAASADEAPPSNDDSKPDADRDDSPAGGA
jgi:hypothetical protein